MNTLENLWTARFGDHAAPQPDQAIAPAFDTIRLLLQHRTHRLYTDQPVTDDVLQTVLGCAMSAPSKSDLQQASIIVVDDAQKRARLAALIPAMPWIAQAPVFCVFVADGYRIEQLCARHGLPFANDNLDNFLAAVSDASLALMNAITAAEALGLGCCPISVLRNHMQPVQEMLELPRRVVPLAGLCVGYPARDGFVSLRLPPPVTMHKNRYDADAVAREIDGYDTARDARFALPAERQKYTDRFGVASFYGWSEDKARQMAVEERADVGTFVREHGFALR